MWSWLRSLFRLAPRRSEYPMKYGVREVEFKVGVRVDLYWLRPDVLRVVEALARTAPPLQGGVMVITSVSDGVHGALSLHYTASGFDVRYLGRRTGGIEVAPDSDRERKKEAQAWAARARKVAGPAAQIVVKSDHLHAEVDWNQ